MERSGSSMWFIAKSALSDRAALSNQLEKFHRGRFSPGVAVKWSRPWDLLAQHHLARETVEKQFSAMAAGLSLVLAAAWNAWRLDVA
jgi:hypothetical protein